MYVEQLLEEQQRKFEAEFKSLVDEALIERFNKQVRCLNGNTIRKVYLKALKDEILHRDFDSSIVIRKCGFRLDHKVRLENRRLVYA